MSELMDLIATLDGNELDDEIDNMERQLAVLRSIRKAIAKDGGENGRPVRAYNKRPVSEEVSLRWPKQALGILRKRGNMSFTTLREELRCSPTHLKAALENQWFVKGDDGYSLSAAGEKAVREEMALKNGAK